MPPIRPLTPTEVEAAARRQGIGESPMRAAEAAAARPSERCGWIRVGEIPAHAPPPRGEPRATAFYNRRLA